MAGSHEVRGSNPLFSTMNSIAGRTIGQRFFYLQARGLELREVLRSRRFLFDGFSSFGAFLLGYLGFRARISRLACTLSGHLVFCATFLGAGVAGCVQDAHCEGNLVLPHCFPACLFLLRCDPAFPLVVITNFAGCGV